MRAANPISLFLFVATIATSEASAIPRNFPSASAPKAIAGQPRSADTRIPSLRRRGNFCGKFDIPDGSVVGDENTPFPAGNNDHTPPLRMTPEPDEGDELQREAPFGLSRCADPNTDVGNWIADLPNPREPVRYSLYVDSPTCTRDQPFLLEDAIRGLDDLAQAGHAAVSDFWLGHSRNPAYLFFKTPIWDSTRDLYVGASRYAKGGQHTGRGAIRITCEDEHNMCGGVRAAYVSLQDRKTIVICPLFYAYPSHLENPPCEPYENAEGQSLFLSEFGIHGIGSTSKAQILLHMFAHVWLGTATDWPLEAQGLRESHGMMQTNPVLASRNPDSYAWLGSLAFGFGLHPEFSARHTTCLNHWTPNEMHFGTAEFPSDEAWLQKAFPDGVPPGDLFKHVTNVVKNRQKGLALGPDSAGTQREGSPNPAEVLGLA